MPVSTRSHINNPSRNELIPDQRTSPKSNQEQNNASVPLKNPHHGLKEKMKALTLLYEQQKQASFALKNQSLRSIEDPRFTTDQCLNLHCSCKREDKETKPESKSSNNVMRENTLIPNSTVTRTYVLPQPSLTGHDIKENVAIGNDRILSFSTCPQRSISTGTDTVARKLSMGGLGFQQKELKVANVSKNVQELDYLEPHMAVSEKPKLGESRILVFVRLRPMANKEKEAGSKSCVKIVNKRDVYLIEFAHESDYLRLKRLKGRHFTFDASFPDFTTQQEVYQTT